MAKKVRCPYCNERFDLDDYAEEGDTVACPVCDGDLEIASLEPPRVQKLVEDSYDAGDKDESGGDYFDDEDSGGRGRKY